MVVIGAAALLFFGPDQLPKVARRAGQVMREVQNTSQSFIREMERAADDIDLRERLAANPPTPRVAAHESPSPEADEGAAGIPESAAEHPAPGPAATP